MQLHPISASSQDIVWITDPDEDHGDFEGSSEGADRHAVSGGTSPRRAKMACLFEGEVREVLGPLLRFQLRDTNMMRIC